MTIDAPKTAQIPQLRQLWKEAFGDTDTFLDSFFSLAFAPERCRCITLGDTVPSALYWFDCTCRGEKWAYLYAVATAETERGKGLCRALMTQTHAHLKMQGYRGTVLVPATAGLRKMYAGMGYLPGTTVAEVTCTSGGQSVELELLDGEEYRRRRAEMVPADAVLHEDAFMALLQAQYGLFGGEGVLLAAWMEDGVLYAEEFLGDPAAAPGVVRALGAETGSFRVPGGEKEFAMYCPLTAPCPRPGYFGISFG